MAGFNQFFDDISGTRSWRYGVALDHEIDINKDKSGPELYSGIEFSKRDLDVPVIVGSGLEVVEFDQEERFGRAYIYWTPLDWITLSSEYRFDRFVADPDAISSQAALAKSKTHRVPVEARFFKPSGFFGRARATYVNQNGRFETMTGIVPDNDEFVVVDALVGYRFPKRLGLAAIEVRNLFDEDFKFQDVDPFNPEISKGRVFSARLTLSF